jgi:hypothetical protein
VDLQIRIPFWEKDGKCSSTFSHNGQLYVAYLNEVESNNKNAPKYEVVIKTYKANYRDKQESNK